VTAPTDPYVWHLVMTRTGQPIDKGERIATLSLSPADVAARGGGDLAAGLRAVRRALDAERVVWARRVIAAGFVDGYGVSIHAERGYRRSIFPAVHVAGIVQHAPPGASLLRKLRPS
jgi:hypothetical protein